MIILVLFCILFGTQSHAMEPITSAKLRSMHDDRFADNVQQNVNDIVRQIYNKVIMSATNGATTKCVHIVPGVVVGRFLEKDITIEHVKDHVVAELRRLFPDSNILFVERRPDADIFSTGRRPVAKPHSDGVDRAFVVDWGTP